MKNETNSLLIILIAIMCIFCACRTIDPIEPTHRYFLENKTDNSITIKYKFSSDAVTTDTTETTKNVKSNTTFEFTTKDENAYYFQEKPSWTFSKIVVLDNNGDTILNQNPIDDSKWICEPHIDDYGYIVTNNYWTLVVGE